MHTSRTSLVRIILSAVGVVLLTASACIYVRAVARSRAHNWEPLVLPVSLHPGTIRTPMITVDRDGEYDIVLEFDQKYDIRTMECLMGIDISTAGNPDRCKQLPSLIEVSWILYEGDRLVSEGDSNNDRTYFWSSTAERMLGKFSGQKGHEYRLTLEIKHDAAELNAANPKLKVVVPHGTSEDYYAGIYIEKLEAIGFGLIGILVMISLLLTKKLRRRAVTASQS